MIIPKINPVLPLDANGLYKIKPEDLATYPRTTDSPVVVTLSPQSVDCSMLGKQNILVKALSNGAATGPQQQFNVGFPGAISGICYDTKGNLYVTELRSYAIRKITPEGDVTILAGAGERGGSDGPGDKARFGTLFGIVCDNSGNVYVSDADNNSIRKITPDGTVSTFAGTGFQGAVNGTGNKASFNFPHGITIDAAGNIYVADFGNKMIRKITPQALVTTIATTAVYSYDVAAGPDGYVYWGSQNGTTQDNYVSGVYRVKEGGTVELYAGSNESVYKDGPRAQARFEGVFGLCFGEGGNLFTTDYNRIRRISPDGMVSTFDGQINLPLYLATDPCGNLAVANEETITRLTMGGQSSIIASGNYPRLTGKVPASICQFTETSLPVTVQSKPVLPAITDKTVMGCAALANYTLNLMATDNCPGATITYEQIPAAGTPFNGTAPVGVTITATDGTGGTDSKTFNVINSGSNTVMPSVKIIANTDQLCAGDVAVFHAEVSNSDAGTSYQWQVNGINAGTGNPDFASSNLQNNDLVNCIVTTGGGCGVPNAANGITVTVKEKPIITLDPSVQILAGNSITLKPAVTAGVVAFKWEPSAGLNDARAQYPVASPGLTTTYKLTVTTTNGCQSEAFEEVKVVNEIVIPNTFTPNADGVNDLWVINYLAGYGDCTVRVYNRYGVGVYSSHGYPVAWNGTSNGKALATGVYYYIIDLKDGSPALSGSLSIIR